MNIGPRRFRTGLRTAAGVLLAAEAGYLGWRAVSLLTQFAATQVGELLRRSFVYAAFAIAGLILADLRIMRRWTPPPLVLALLGAAAAAYGETMWAADTAGGPRGMAGAVGFLALGVVMLLEAGLDSGVRRPPR